MRSRPSNRSRPVPNGGGRGTSSPISLPMSTWKNNTRLLLLRRASYRLFNHRHQPFHARFDRAQSPQIIRVSIERPRKFLASSRVSRFELRENRTQISVERVLSPGTSVRTARRSAPPRVRKLLLFIVAIAFVPSIRVSIIIIIVIINERAGAALDAVFLSSSSSSSASTMPFCLCGDGVACA